jgi:hypothetical protein
MDNYKKGNGESPLSSTTSLFYSNSRYKAVSIVEVVDVDSPIHNYPLDDNCIHMQVKDGSKVANMMNYAYNNFQV